VTLEQGKEEQEKKPREKRRINWRIRVQERLKKKHFGGKIFSNTRKRSRTHTHTYNFEC